MITETINRDIPRTINTFFICLLEKINLLFLFTYPADTKRRDGIKSAAVYFIAIAIPTMNASKIIYLRYQSDLEYKIVRIKKNNVTKNAMGTSTIAKLAWVYSVVLNTVKRLPIMQK